MQPGTLEINEVAEGSCHVGQLILLDPAYRLRLDGEHGLVGVNLIEVSEQLVGVFDQQLGEIGVKLRPGASLDLSHGDIDISREKRTSPRSRPPA